MLFTELLKKHKLERTGVSHGLQTKMKRYDRFAKGVEEEKEKLKTASGTTKEKIEAEITKAEENMAALNEEICLGIENSVKNKDLNAKRAEILKNARASKGNGGGKPKTFTVEGVAAKVFKKTALTQKEEIDFYNTNKEAIDGEVAKLTDAANQSASTSTDEGSTHLPVQTEKKKNGSVLGWIIGGVVLVGAALLGIKAYQNSQKSKV